jgi:hypothetical protein
MVLNKPPQNRALAERFASLAEQWLNAVELVSSTSQMIEHPAYRAIIALGVDVVPLLLQSLESGPIHWFEALETITGENPVPAEHWGRIMAMRGDWLDWGRNRGLI